MWSAREIQTRWDSVYLLVLLACAMLICLSGCGGAGSPHPVDGTTARQTLEEVLQSWRDGKTIESWREHEPEVVVQDMDWMSGKKLTAFELLGDGKAVDANLHCEVKLTLASEANGKEEQTVTYLVSTSPTITVFRQMMQ